MPSRTRSTLLLSITLIATLALGSLPACRDDEPSPPAQDASEESFAPARVEAVSEPAIQTTPLAEVKADEVEAAPEGDETLPESEQLSEEALELAFQIEALRQQQQGQKDAVDGDDEDEDGADEDGGAEEGGASLAVFSKPPADIFVDGKNTGFRTPKTLPIEPGQHDVRVRFDNKELSEKKVVKVKDGARVRLTFQQSLASKTSTKKEKKKVVTLQPALLILVTNFDKADATVNGLPYPEYFEDPKDEGMLIPAGGPYDVKVTYDGKSKDYTLSLKPYEKRYLVVELTGFKGAAAPAPARPSSPVKPPPTAKEEPAKKDEEGSGKITVYSKPRGDIMIDGKSVGQRTPNTIDAEEGRHEVQVRYESGETSEPKIVRVRKGSRIKLFFREQNSK